MSVFISIMPILQMRTWARPEKQAFPGAAVLNTIGVASDLDCQSSGTQCPWFGEKERWYAMRRPRAELEHRPCAEAKAIKSPR